VWLKYSSKHTAIATINIRFNILPTPKYIRIENRDKDIEIIRPRRELAKIREKVKRAAIKNVIKNNGTTQNVTGSTK
jgi:hypothetical protein